jgi:membrane protease YdiL (CAAX protease family)
MLVSKRFNPMSIALSNQFFVEGRIQEQAGVKKPKKVQSAASSIFQGALGFGLGLGMHRIYGPLTEKVVRALGVSTSLPDPFGGLGFVAKIVLAPLVCVIGPILEEWDFRGLLQEDIKKSLLNFYSVLGSAANTAARVTSLFFTSIIFGVVHFSNALIFWCNPILFLPQVIAATFMGLLFGLAKELTGSLSMPIGMHIGNNTLAWAHYLSQ